MNLRLYKYEKMRCCKTSQDVARDRELTRDMLDWGTIFRRFL